MVGASGQARVGGIGRFGDQYHHGVVGGAMSRIPEHQVGWSVMHLSDFLHIIKALILTFLNSLIKDFLFLFL